MKLPLIPEARLYALDAARSRHVGTKAPEGLRQLAEPARASEPLNLSGTAVAARALAASPPVDAAKVAALKTAIAAGSYRIDPQAIAAKMIALDLPRA